MLYLSRQYLVYSACCAYIIIMKTDKIHKREGVRRYVTFQTVLLQWEVLDA